MKKNSKKEPNPAEEIIVEESSECNPPETSQTVSELNLELEILNDKYLRLGAEYQNFRKRSQKEKESIYPDAVASTVSEFLSLVDNFKRALEAECSDENYKKGMEMTYSSLTSALSKLNVEEFGSIGDTFDPNIHDAVMHCEQEDVDSQTITDVFQKGYRIGEKILRFAMVKVAN